MNLGSSIRYIYNVADQQFDENSTHMSDADVQEFAEALAQLKVFMNSGDRVLDRIYKTEEED